MAKKLTKSTNRGTGMSHCFTPQKTIKALNNTPIDAGAIALFLRSLSGCADIRVTLSNRRPKWRWGTAWPSERRMILYRHSVMVFLHELAHIKGKTCYHRVGFARELDRLVIKWEAWKGGSR